MGFGLGPDSIEEFGNRGHRLLVIGSDTEAIPNQYGESVEVVSSLPGSPELTRGQ